MRDYIDLYINGIRHRVTGRGVFLSLADYLREELGLVGTKIVCSEGDCGACTILCGRPHADRRIVYRAIDSCIQRMFQLDGTHVVTVEGLPLGSKDIGGLTPIQRAMVTCHGSQCGFCTPGFVVAMTGLCEENAQLDDAVLRQGLTGNLCRCTGYSPILAAGREADRQQYDGITGTYDTEGLYGTLSEIQSDSFTIECRSAERWRRVMSPATIAEALECLSAWPAAKVVAGATDVGVQINKRTIDPDVYLDLNRVSELEAIEQHQSAGGRAWDVGARASWTQLEQLSRSEVPELWKIISVFGAPQIRHVGTIGGNIVNASPIADSLPFLLVMESTLQLQSVAGSRRVNINNFYRGYKDVDLAPAELLTRVRIPLPRPDELLRLYKVSRRRDMDIATFTAAILIRLEGNTISDARIAFGAVGPTVLRAAQTEQFLVGKPFCEQTFFSAGDVAVTDVHPISDVRGSADYRYRLTRNSLLKFYHENAATNAA